MSSETTSTLTRLAPTQVELEIPLAPGEIEAAQRRAFGRLARKTTLPGFRPGKVPRHLFEQMYGKDLIENEALDDLAPIAYERAVQEHALDPLGNPEIRVMPREQGKPERLKATVEVRPDFTLPQYLGVAVEVPSQPVADTDVERGLAALARERATLVPVDRPARFGDMVTIDYEGRIGDVVLEGATASGQETELAQGRFIPGFAEAIAGMRAGETSRFDLTFPKEYPHPEYAGKDATFTATLHEVKEIELPPLDDEFAKTVADCQTLAELRTMIRARLEAVAEAQRRRAVAKAVMEHLLSSTEIPVPPNLVDRETETILAEASQGAAQSPSGEERERAQREAVAHVKSTFLIEAIARAEGIEATSEEVRHEVVSMARRYGISPERMRGALKGRLGAIKDGIVRRKTLDLLVDGAAPKEATVHAP